MDKHLMELPKKVLIGHAVIEELGEFLKDLGLNRGILVVTGEHVKSKIGGIVEDALSNSSLKAQWITVGPANLENVLLVEEKARADQADAIVGLGGGRIVDVAKLASFRDELPFLSVPTSASHDGISSPLASIKGMDRPYSMVARPPLGILVDIDVVVKAPRRLLASGCGDLISKITAVKDWELAREEKGEYFGKYSASLARLSASVVTDEAEKIGRLHEESIRDVIEALISAGVAIGIAGSSRPCSGSEHLFSHALDFLAPGVGLHGEKCGLGTIMMAKLHGLDYEEIADALEKAGGPTKASQVGIPYELVPKALVAAASIRKERYTILSKLNLTLNEAEKVAISTGIL